MELGVFDEVLCGIKSSPVVGGGLAELDEHRQRGHLGAVALGAAVREADGRECGFNRVRGSQVLLVFGGEFVKRVQLIAVFLEAGRALSNFVPSVSRKLSNTLIASARFRAIQISCSLASLHP